MASKFDQAVPGDIFLARISGAVGGLVWLGQLLNGDVSKWTHTGLVMPDSKVFQAEPGGARIDPQSQYDGHEIAVLHRPLVSPTQREMMVAVAQGLKGSGYNWDTYLYLAAYRLRIPGLTGLLRSRVSKPTKMICSQAVDWIALQAGDHLFDDGRLPYDVVPGDLARLRAPHTVWL